jgi:hypothetical protein
MSRESKNIMEEGGLRGLQRLLGISTFLQAKLQVQLAQRATGKRLLSILSLRQMCKKRHLVLFDGFPDM